VEEYQKLQLFNDKKRTVLLAREMGIPHPKTLFLEDVWIDRNLTSESFDYPVVVKGRKGKSARQVWYAGNPSELESLITNLTTPTGVGISGHDRSDFLLQEYIPGELHDVAAIFSQGELRAGLTQKRLLTKPSSGGPGVVNVTTFDGRLLDLAKSIGRYVGWNGVILIDFKIDDRDNCPKLLEINPRFWGTTWLTIRAGLNYPHYLILQSLGKTIVPPVGYTRNLTGRWPLLELETIFARPVTPVNLFVRAAEFIARFRGKDVVYDIDFYDLMPHIGMVLGRFGKQLSGRS
jgi:predicted ATP-grasp superfamily ATP-dependent carboligase